MIKLISSTAILLSLTVPLSGGASSQTIESHGLPQKASGAHYVVVAIRRASDVVAGPIDRSLGSIRIGQTVRFTKPLQWLWGTRCWSWSIELRRDPVVNLRDPMLSDTQVLPPGGTKDWPDRRQNSHHSIKCDGKGIGAFTRIDERSIVAPSRSGASYVILERPLGPIETAALQKQLISMKFLSGEASGSMDQRTRRAVAAYARYLGAAYDFRNGAVTENLLAGLGVERRGSRGGEDRKADTSTALEVVKVIHNGPLSAHFTGEVVPLAPQTYGVRELWFTFRDDPKRYRFRPTGTLHFSDWYFDAIYSPGLRYVLLPQGHYGPYHVVQVENLRAYLSGRRGPDHVVGEIAGPDRTASVHSDPEWLSADEIRFTVACCGSTRTKTVRLSGRADTAK